MTDLPEPFTPPEADLRGMPYMPLDVVRLFDSDFYALSTGDEFKAGLSLWCKAFLQQPAGSLPDDDRLLAHLSGAAANWKRVKDMALRGWVKCSDGRLYHKTVAEKVTEAWRARCDRRARTEAARAARHAARVDSGSDAPPSATEPVTKPVTENVTTFPTRNATSSVTDAVTGSKGSTREQKGREQERKKERPFATLTPSAGAEDGCDFEAFWSAYPRKVGKGQARRAFAAAIRKATISAILDALARAEFSPDPRYQPHPATWLNGERWLDQTDTFDPVLRAAGLTPEDFEHHEPPQGTLLQ